MSIQTLSPFKVTLWSPSETRRLATSRVGAQQSGMDAVVPGGHKTENADATSLLLKDVHHVEWPSLSLLSNQHIEENTPTSTSTANPTSSKTVVTLFPGESIFIPEGWFHQVREF
jgi:hypothetical protein